MKIAITADLHLTTQEANPDRFQALADILKQCESNQIEALIIAGDLFDREKRNFADFESVYRACAPESLSSYIIPGNHDVGLVQKNLTLDRVKVINETDLVDLDKNFSFLFVPYLEGVTMGEEIAHHKEELKLNQWVLIGHGDWVGATRSPDPYEPGIYMPITNADITNYKPLKVFLGHIHLPSDSDVIHYVGSPCPVKISETGKRRLILFDSETQEVSQVFVRCPQIYFIEKFVVYPLDDEPTYLKKRIQERIAGWELPAPLDQEVAVRVSLTGYSSDRAKAGEIVREEFAAFQFIDEEGPLLGDLGQADDPARDHLVKEVKKWIDEELVWEGSESEPSKDAILLAAMKTIYGV